MTLLRYVVLAHDHPKPHFDLMLELDGRLRTWRLSALPNMDRAIPAAPIGDHRLEYLDYEGPVTGGRGTVRRVAAGALTWEAQSADRMSVSINGTWVGRLVLCRQGDEWTVQLNCE